MNPYAPPDEQRPPEPPRQVIALPGWLVFAFAVGGLLVPLAAVEDSVPGGKDMRMNQILFAALYGAPMVVAVFVFGIANLRRHRDVRLSTAGLIVAGIEVLALPLAIVLR